jgi:hypothetical protein
MAAAEGARECSERLATLKEVRQAAERIWGSAAKLGADRRVPSAAAPWLGSDTAIVPEEQNEAEVEDNE